jgi:hypothetical protein
MSEIDHATLLSFLAWKSTRLTGIAGRLASASRSGSNSSGQVTAVEKSL